jgi:hypothetical protein
VLDGEKINEGNPGEFPGKSAQYTEPSAEERENFLEEILEKIIKVIIFGYILVTTTLVTI